MAKTVVVVLLAIFAIAAYLTVKEEGVEEAFGGAFAPMETVRDPSAKDNPGRSLGLASSPMVDPAQSHYGKMVDRVRTRTNAAMKKSKDRYSEY